MIVVMVVMEVVTVVVMEVVMVVVLEVVITEILMEVGMNIVWNIIIQHTPTLVTGSAPMSALNPRCLISMTPMILLAAMTIPLQHQLHQQ